MIRVDKGHISIKCLAVLVLVLSEPTYADSFVCVAERANGFVYDQENKSWEVSSFSVENKKYLVSPADENDIFVKALKYDYEIRDVGSTKPVIHCKAIKETDSNQETGLILCLGSVGASFNIDKASGRYVRSQPSGYVTKKTSSETGDGSYMEVGNCSPK
jgi:hypothetical protein